MSVKNIEELLTGYFAPIIQDSGCNLWNVEFVKEGPNWYVRVYIDKESGITIDDCETISRKVEAVLDEKDPITQAYILEVSSPGIDRPLKKDEDFVRYMGQIIDIKLYKSINKSKEFQGQLLAYKNGQITIKDDNNQELYFEKKDVASCRLAVIF